MGYTNRNIERCIASVEAALPMGAKHLIIDVPHHSLMTAARRDALKFDELITFVDDDDYIHPDSLKLCLDALTETKAGLSFTNESLVRPNGEIVHRPRRLLYEQISLQVDLIHHLVMFRTAAVTSRAIELAKQHDRFNEWIFYADAASVLGAVHVPIDGYFWVQHPDQHHKMPSYGAGVMSSYEQVRPILQSWQKRMGPIPLWTKKLPAA